MSLIPFENAAWAPDRHSQTILGDWIPSKPMSNQGERLIVDLPDGDQLFCRLIKGSSPFMICLFHGLTGNAKAGYMQRIAKTFAAKGHSVCLVNHRNCGEGFGLAKKPYHAGASEDLSRVIFDLKQIMPSKKIFSMGFSMSGNATLLLSSGVIPTQKIFSLDQFEEKKSELRLALPDYVISVNPPVDLLNSQKGFRKSINPLYEWNFIHHLKTLGLRLEDKAIFNSMKASYRMTIKDFDDAYTSKRSGFKDALDYYDKCSSSKYLNAAAIPTMVITSKDDPFIDYTDFDKTKKSSSVQWHYSEGGGHMGYLHKSKLPYGDFRWMDYAVVEFQKQMVT